MKIVLKWICIGFVLGCDLERIPDSGASCNDPSAYTFESSFTAGIQDSASSVIKTSSGIYAMTGNTQKQGSKILVYETNLCQENLLHIGIGDNLSTHTGSGLAEMANGDLLVSGTQYSAFSGNKAYVARINKNNVITDLWNEKHDKGLKCHDIIPLLNGNYLLGCSVYTTGTFTDQDNGYLVCLDPNLDVLFSVKSTTTFSSSIYKVVEAGSGDYIGIGTLWIGFGQRILFIRANSSGIIEYQDDLTFGTISGDNNVYGISAEATSDGNIIITGYYWQLLGTGLITFIKKVNIQGETIWEFEYTNSLMEIIGDHTPSSVIETSEGGFLVVGTHNLGSGNSDVFLLKVDPNGAYSWDRSHGGSLNEVAHDVLQETDGGFVVVGFTDSFNQSGESGRLYFVKTDSLGKIN